MSNLLILLLIFIIPSLVLSCYIIYLIIKALQKYIRSKDVRNEKTELCKSLGEILKEHRIKNKMTQEFVAESLGVSRQAVSKWENGTSDPSTFNLLSLAKLYKMNADDLLKEVNH